MVSDRRLASIYGQALSSATRPDTFLGIIIFILVGL